MTLIPERYLEQLRSAGILTGEPFVHTHIGFPDGMIVAKPSSVPGHSLPDYECGWGMTDIILDAPDLFFHSDDGKWVVTSHDYIPGPGPGDFVNVWNSPEEAVADILDFYFGSPTRMDIKRQAQKGPTRQYVYLRLIDKVEIQLTESERLKRVQSAIEKFGDVEWKQPPSLHGRGGYIVCITIPAPPDYDALLSHVDHEGFASVI